MEKNQITAAIIADDEGMGAETASVAHEARRLGLNMVSILDEGSQVKMGDEIVRFRGTPRQVVASEEVLIGIIAKPSGITTAARLFVEKAGDRPNVVSGAWKKMPAPQKETIRKAVVAGGAFIRMSPNPFVYLDKNYIRILGGIRKVLRQSRTLKTMKRWHRSRAGMRTSSPRHARPCSMGLIS